VSWINRTGLGFINTLYVIGGMLNLLVWVLLCINMLYDGNCHTVLYACRNLSHPDDYVYSRHGALSLSIDPAG
jgi:hypothetical protein